jgi:hypothetical protein
MPEYQSTEQKIFTMTMPAPENANFMPQKNKQQFAPIVTPEFRPLCLKAQPYRDYTLCHIWNAEMTDLAIANGLLGRT